MSKVKNFLNRNIVLVVMVPSIVLIHVGWDKMQDVDKFRAGYEREEIPIIVVSIKLQIPISFLY